MFIYLIIAVVIGGGASIAAENSLPGDFLYGMKTQVNERVMGTLAVGAEADARFEARLAEKRLEEMERLSAKGTVESSVAASLQERFETHADNAGALFASLEAEAALEAASNFESTLRAHSEIIAGLRGRESDDATVLTSLSAKILGQISSTLQAKIKAEGEIAVSTDTSLEASARAKLTSTEKKIAEVRAYVESKKTALGASATAAAEANLAASATLVVEGKTRLEAGSFGEALILFQEAYQEADEAKILIELNSDIDVKLDLQTNTEIDTNNTNIEVNGSLNLQ